MFYFNFTINKERSLPSPLVSCAVFSIVVWHRGELLILDGHVLSKIPWLGDVHI
jgi:hypothetical protein